MRLSRTLLFTTLPCAIGLHVQPLPARAARFAEPHMVLKAGKSGLELDPEAASALLEDGPAAAQGPFGKGGALEWVANVLDKAAEDTLSLLHAFDDKAVQDSSKNLQVLWSRAVLARNGELKDDVAYKLLPESTRGVVEMGVFDGVSPFLEWVAARTVFLNEGTDAFLSSPSCANGKDCQVVIVGAGFDTRSIRYQREGLKFFEVDLPDTIEAKRVVHERYKAEVDPSVRLPARVGFDLNDCEQRSLLDVLEKEHGFRRDVPTLFISEAVLFYVNPKAIASLWGEMFAFGQSHEAMYCFTDSMRPFVQGPFSDESMTFFDNQGVDLLAHSARWSGAVQFCHAVARTPDKHERPDSLRQHVSNLVEAPVNSYAPERSAPKNGLEPSFNNTWYAIAYAAELGVNGQPYSTRLFGEPLILKGDWSETHVLGTDGGEVTCVTELDNVRYEAVVHQDIVWVWRGAAENADRSLLPTHPTPEQTHTVETILDYGCDWKYIVENNLDTPHLYWLHDGSIPPIESLGCSRKNIASIGLRLFKDDIGVGHIGKTSKKVTKVVRYDAPNVVRHGGVSGFSEEFNIVPIGPHRTRVLLRQRFPKGPILSTLLNLPGTAAILQYLVRNWNYQIGLEDYSVMQGQAHNIDDYGAPNWKAVAAGDDLIIKFWKWTEKAFDADAVHSEYFTRWDGTPLDHEQIAKHHSPIPREAMTHGSGEPASAEKVRGNYMAAPIADYPPINFQGYTSGQGLLESLPKKAEDFVSSLPSLRVPAVLGASAGLVVGATAVLPESLWPFYDHGAILSKLVVLMDVVN